MVAGCRAAHLGVLLRVAQEWRVDHGRDQAQGAFSRWAGNGMRGRPWLMRSSPPPARRPGSPSSSATRPRRSWRARIVSGCSSGPRTASTRFACPTCAWARARLDRSAVEWRGTLMPLSPRAGLRAGSCLARWSSSWGTCRASRVPAPSISVKSSSRQRCVFATGAAVAY